MPFREKKNFIYMVYSYREKKNVKDITSFFVTSWLGKRGLGKLFGFGGLRWSTSANNNNNTIFHPIISTIEKIYGYIEQMIGVLAARNNLIKS